MTDPAEAGEQLKDPREMEDEEQETEQTVSIDAETLNVAALNDPGEYVVTNEDSGTGYLVDLTAIKTESGQPCECGQAHYRQAPEDADVCKHVQAAAKAAPANMTSALRHELGAIRHTVDALLQATRELQASSKGLAANLDSPSQNGSQTAEKDLTVTAETAAEKLNDAWPVDGMEAVAGDGVVWVSNGGPNSDAPDWTFDSFLRDPDAVNYDPNAEDHNPPEYFYNNYIRPEDVESYIQEVLK